MHVVRVRISAPESPDGEQWLTYKFREDELDYMLAKLREWEARGVPFEHQRISDGATPEWYFKAHQEATQEMAEEADDYNPESEWPPPQSEWT